MKIRTWLGTLVALSVPILGMQAQTPDSGPPAPGNGATPPTATAPSVSPAAADVVRMAESGTGEDVLVAYVKNSNGRFELSADQILYLRDVGITSPVITAMLNRDAELKTQPQSASVGASAPEPAPPAAPVPANSTPVEAPLTPPSTLEPATAPAAAPVYVSSPPQEVSYFYDSLSPYGTWVQLEGVGWCWQPRVVVVNHSWQPYCNSGHWVYTDAGWFWQSDYSWGWAPFHYGRWHLHDHCGWVWLPDRVWAPAWVTWRSEGSHCGWAPLPPHADFDVHLGWRFNGVHVAANFDFGLHPATFTFISLHDFNNHDYAHYRLPATQVTQIYNHTTVINNYVVNNNTIVNQGIKVDRVREATHTEIKPVAIRETRAFSQGTTAPRAAGRNELVVYRPELKTPPKPVNMVAQKVDDRHPVIQHTPIAPQRPQRVAEANTTVNRSAQERMSRPNAERTQSSAPAQAQPNAHATRPSSSVPPASTTQANAANPAASSSAATKRPESRPSTANQSSSGQPYYPLRASPPDSAHSSPGQSSQTYYPKGHYQANEAYRPAPTGPPQDSRGQGSVNPNSRGTSGSSDSNRGSSKGQSKKNES